jgi:AsmA protein
VPRLDIAPDKSSGETVNLAANLAGSGRNLVARLVLSGVEGNAKALKIGKLALDLDAKVGESAVKARIDSPVAADMAAQTLALEKLAGSLDLANPQMPMKQLKLPLSGSLRADLAKQSAALDLGTRFDESKIALKLKVAKFAPLALGFDLDIDTLNVDKYLPPKKAEEKVAASPAPAGKDAAADKLDFSALKGHDVNGALRIGALQVSKLKLAKLDAKIRLAGGRLDVAPLSMNLYEGSASGSLSLNAAGNQLALKQNLNGISINPLLKDLADKDLLEGRGNVALDVASRGDSVAAMKKALAGTASLSLKDGAIKGINLAQSMRDIKAKLGTLQGKAEGTTQKARAGEKTDFLRTHRLAQNRQRRRAQRRPGDEVAFPAACRRRRHRHRRRPHGLSGQGHPGQHQHRAGRQGSRQGEGPHRAGAHRGALRRPDLQARTRRPGRRHGQGQARGEGRRITGKTESKAKDKLKGLFGK